MANTPQSPAIPPFQCYGGSLTITVELPDDLATHANPSRDALEALAIEGYRSGALSAYQTRVLLGFETRYELDGFLKAHDVWEHAYDLDDYRSDMASLQRLDERGLLKG